MIGLLAVLALGHVSVKDTLPHWPDRVHLVSASNAAGVNPLATLAVAWEESGDNLNPALRAHYCWHPTYFDKQLGLWVGAVHRPDCEVGRFQIKPSTAKARCPGQNIWTYKGNLACFLSMFGADSKKYGEVTAIRIHNGSGKLAKEYTQRVLAIIGLTYLLKHGILDL